MVYCGKPSRGCQMCRTRRIKCDETKPTCNQCLKSRRQCPGYKDEFDLVLRNETKATARRAQKADRKAVAQRTGRAGQEIILPVSSSGFRPSPTFQGAVKSPLNVGLTRSVQTSLEDQASCLFVSNFVLVPRQGGTRGYMDYLVPLLASGSRQKHLEHAFNACALAFLGNRVGTGGGELNHRGFAEYTQALSATTMAIQDPETAKSDVTLAAVLLMGMYESITAREIGDFTWGTHVEGAINIVKQRGRKQLRTKTGLMLFIAVRTQLIIHTLSSGKPPIMGVEWWINDAVKDEAAAACQRINLKTSELRAEITRVMSTVARTPESIDLMFAMMRRAQSLDQEIVNWMKSTPASWQPKATCWEDNVPDGDYSKAHVFPGRVDVYSDFWIASMWNMARTTRLILASVTVRCAAWICSPVDYRTTPEFATASRTAVEVITDILASVPYHLGWQSKRKDHFEDNPSGFACGDDNAMKGLAGYFLTWSLSCVMSQDYATDAQRTYCRGRLRFIGGELGVRYAVILSQLQVRIPSMLIGRDGMTAQPYQSAHNFEELLSAGPNKAYMSPQQREALKKELYERGRAGLLSKASGGPAGNAMQLMGQNLLSPSRLTYVDGSQFHDHDLRHTRV